MSSIVLLLLVASTEIFRFLLFLGFGVVGVVRAVPEDEEEKVEVEVDPGQDPNDDSEVLSDDISDEEFFKGCE
jgi:hypothetical protein